MNDAPCRPMKVAVLCAGLFACSSSSGASPLQDHFEGGGLPPVEASAGEDAGGAADSGASSDSTVVSPTDSSADVVPEVAPPISGCNAIVPAGPLVSETAVDASEPAATGGTIATGTYFLTEIDLYGAPMTGQVVQRTLVVDAAKMNFSEVIGGSAEAGAGATDAGTTDNSTSTYTVYGNVVSLGEYCPTNGSADNVFFSVQGNQLTLFVTVMTANVYTLQPSSDP